MFWLDSALSYSYNSYTGSVLSTQGGVCIGNAQIACAGIENGYSAYWDSYGNFVGATTFVELYAQVAGGIGRASAGYEWGLLGMEGRDFYVGANVAGIHGELSHIGGGDGKKADFNWGVREEIYLAYGNNSSRQALDGETTSLVNSEIWIPSLGKYGHFDLGLTGYDVSNQGIHNALLNEIVPMLEKSENAEDRYLAKQLSSGKKISQAGFERIERCLKRNGFENVSRPNGHGKESIKKTYRLSGSFSYGNIELILTPQKIYSSYNYGNNPLSHLIIDYFGYKGRGYN